MKAVFTVHGPDRPAIEASAYTQAREALGEEPTTVEIVEMRPLAYHFVAEEPVLWEADVEAS